MPSLPFAEGAVLTTVSRSGRVESCHRGSVAVWHDSDLLLSVGAPAQPVICRSATKPLQALPFLERGLEKTIGATDAEIAVMCASHDGTEAHTACVRGFLQKAGLHEGQLGCGPHAPFDTATRQAMLLAAQKPMRVHNNCSGKHTGFLCLAKACGDNLGNYLDPSSKSQKEVAAAVAAMAGVSGVPERGVDGCGAPTFVLPLQALARSFAKLANPVGESPVRAAACQRILAAVRAEPQMLAGKKRLCTALLQSSSQVAFAKNGAEGIYAVALAPNPKRARCPGAVGIAVKIDDGQDRGYESAVVDLMRHLGVFGAAVPAALQPFHQPKVMNTREQQVGDVRCIVEWGSL